MLRQIATRGRSLTRAASALGNGARQMSCKTEGSSIAAMIKAVEGTSATSLASSMSSLKTTIAPHYPEAAASSGLSVNAMIAIGALVGWIIIRINTQATSHDWIVDLSLNVLQAAWWISFLSFLPFRSIYVALRGMAPHSSVPLAGLRPAFQIKP
eukprot:gene13198-19033_t